MDAARVALAFVARRQGSSEMATSAWAHVLSLELGWLPPGDAKRFVAACAQAGLLQGEPPRITFDPKSVETPRGFRLTPDVVPEAAPEDPFMDLVKRIATSQGVEPAAVFAAMAETQESHGGMLDAPAALLLWAQGQGMDVRDDAATWLKTALK